MNTHADETQENKSQTVTAEASQIQSGGESTFQFVDNRPEAVAQRKLQEMANNSPQVSQLRAFQDMANNSPQVKQTAQLQTMADNHSSQQRQPIQRQENKTGLPDNLKAGMENLSGISLDDVKVHRNSDKPAQLQAHAYAQGTDIHLGSGQEKHLAHELGHVVQQKQGRVKPTMQMKGNVNVNDDKGLEKEADVMGDKALQLKMVNNSNNDINTRPITNIIQLNSAIGSQQKKQNISNELQQGKQPQAAKQLSEQDKLEIKGLSTASKLLKNHSDTVSLSLKDGHTLDDVERLIKIGVGVGFAKIGIAIGGIAADAASFGTLGEVFTWTGKGVGLGKDMLDAHIKDRIEDSTETSNKSEISKDALNSELQDVSNEQTEGFKEQALGSVVDVDPIKDEIKEGSVELLGQKAVEDLVPILYSLKEIFIGVKEIYSTYKEQKEALGEAAVSNIQSSVESLSKLYIEISLVKENLNSPYFKQILHKVTSLETNMKKALDELITLAVKFQKMRTITKVEKIDWDAIETRPRSEIDVSQIRDEAITKKKSPIKERIGDSGTRVSNMRGENEE
jgi:hypothetical protein